MPIRSRRSAPAVSLLTLLLHVACGGDAGDQTSEAMPEGQDAQAPDTQEEAPRSADAWDPAALCDALDTDAIARAFGSASAGTEQSDRTMLGESVGYCQVMIGPPDAVRVQVYADADERFIEHTGGGETRPLMENPRARRIEGLGTRAVALWANDQFDSPSNNVRAVIADFGGAAVAISLVGPASPENQSNLEAVVEQVRADLGL